MIQEVADKIARGRFNMPLATQDNIIKLISVLADRVNHLEKQLEDVKCK